MLFDKPYVIVDLEATGGDLLRDRVTEIAIIEMQGAVERDRWSSLVNPQQAIPPFVQEITGIRNEMVSQAPIFAELADEIYTRLQGRVLVAHNARFDYGFLKNEFRRLDRRFQTSTLCTVKLSQRLYPDEGKHNLDALIQRHGLPVHERHRALGDAESLQAFIRFLLQQHSPDTLQREIQALKRRTALPAGIDADVVDALPEQAGVYVFYGAGDALLYVGKSINLRARVLEHFYAANRNSKEMKLAQQVCRIEWQETLGEFGALLLEAQWIKQKQPLLNRMGRGEAGSYSIELVADSDGFYQAKIVATQDVFSENTTPLYGLFRHPREAKRVLQTIAEQHGLCQRRLGVEQVTSKQQGPCFAFQVRCCRGACVGREQPAAFNQRLVTALARLKLENWPFPQPIAVVEQDPLSGKTLHHVIDQWCYLGTAEQGLLPHPKTFDADIYRLLRKQLKTPFDHTRVVPFAQATTGG